jgi:hypothetical protein
VVRATDKAGAALPGHNRLLRQGINSPGACTRFSPR